MTHKAKSRATQIKNEREKLLDHINLTLSRSLGTVGDRVRFFYNGRAVEGEILIDERNWIQCRLLKDYRGSNDY